MAGFVPCINRNSAIIGETGWFNLSDEAQDVARRVAEWYESFTPNSLTAHEQSVVDAVQACCAIGDSQINDVPYFEIVQRAKAYIKGVGGFEKFAEWGLY